MVRCWLHEGSPGHTPQPWTDCVFPYADCVLGLPAARLLSQSWVARHLCTPRFTHVFLRKNIVCTILCMSRGQACFFSPTCVHPLPRKSLRQNSTVHCVPDFVHWLKANAASCFFLASCVLHYLMHTWEWPIVAKFSVVLLRKSSPSLHREICRVSSHVCSKLQGWHGRRASSWGKMGKCSASSAMLNVRCEFQAPICSVYACLSALCWPAAFNDYTRQYFVPAKDRYLSAEVTCLPLHSLYSLFLTLHASLLHLFCHPSWTFRKEDNKVTVWLWPHCQHQWRQL